LEVYWKLKSNAKDSVGSNDLTLYNTPTWDSTDNPPMFNYPNTQLETIKRVVVAGNNEIWYESV